MRLQAAGYRTGLIGKWHCGGDETPQPGFDRWFSHAAGQYPHFGAQIFSDQGTVVAEFGHQAALLTDRAVTFIRQRPDERPFFLLVGDCCTHTPLREQPERLVAQYREGAFADIPDEVPAACHGTPRFPWPHAPQARREELAQYYAAVSYIDEQVGRILDALDGERLRENTLVVYTSDHGHMNGHHGLLSKGNATIPQNFLDESIRVPSLWSWPGMLAPQVLGCPVDHLDVFATLLAAAGADAGTAATGEGSTPGRSFLPLLRGEPLPWRQAQFCEYGNARMVRADQLKLVCRYPGPNGHHPDELYDLAMDPRETENRIADPTYANRRAELANRLASHFAAYDIPERSGTRIAEQPVCNAQEPWRLAL
jgi:arylsulfatase A-like enzyme